VPVQVKDNTNNSVLKENVDVDPDETSLISCAGQLENLINDFNLCSVILIKLKNKTFPNPLIFLLESIQVISMIKSKAKQYLINAKNVLQKCQQLKIKIIYLMILLVMILENEAQLRHQLNSNI